MQEVIWEKPAQGHWRGMSGKDSDKAQVPFQDAAAYFSEEEWALLHHWQQELYSNVMKEIHQALIALGPLIATTVCSLKSKEKEEMFSMDNEESESRDRMKHSPGGTMADAEVLFRINNKESLLPSNAPDPRGGQGECLRTGFPFIDTDLLSRKEEPVTVFIDHPGADIRESNITPTSGFPFLDADLLSRKEELVTVFIDHPGATIRESNISPTSGHEIVSLRIKDEAETYCVDHEDSKGMDVISSHSGDERRKRKKTVEDSIKCSEGTPPCKAYSGKINKMVLGHSDEDANHRSLVWSESYQNLRGEKTVECGSSFSNPAHFILHQGSHTIGGSEADNECENNLRNLQFPKDLPNIQQTPTTYTCSEGEKSYILKGESARYTRTNPKERLYACTECEKSFYQKGHLITHRRIHSGEKPFMCGFCQKRFNRKDYLDNHIKIHTGERPYKCTKCEISFIRKSHLNDHQRKYTCSKTRKTVI